MIIDGFKYKLNKEGETCIWYDCENKKSKKCKKTVKECKLTGEIDHYYSHSNTCKYQNKFKSDSGAGEMDLKKVYLFNKV